mmetsp:Transcript_6765/g.10705  ORF Transcript_6765/g.10705 Transcript_6765/m.10705 type:complete len:107 (-) Transcript_6765:835-1155(-)|eukprot:CAMPEP_0203757920 /NCGR_PEP_ID=MMETSP0098-20131031/10761_1 /ASSEMBLY_ACC=CAM_ASM_000208 /TAXON_ID=96639 /ORGANISM=" , Strain NY0313808BC1" /LENGTH=106 /DNA_ID=CAMNT_0050650165 /DNA_START=106 /DNA_END=426 /DNA_ORIENTATION=-
MSADTKLTVPVMLLLEGINHIVTVEMKNGESYRGELTDAEETMNLHMSSVVHTARDGRKKKLEHIFIRGSNVRLVIFPNILKEAKFFRKVVAAKNKEERKQSRGRS